MSERMPNYILDDGNGHKCELIQDPFKGMYVIEAILSSWLLMMIKATAKVCQKDYVVEEMRKECRRHNPHQIRPPFPLCYAC